MIGWREAASAARGGAWEAVLADLAEPGRVAWPEDAVGLAEAREGLRKNLPQAARPVVDLSLLAAILTRAETRPADVGTWVAATLDVEGLLGIGWGDAAGGRWGVCPVPVVQGGVGHIVYLLTGAVPGWAGEPVPCWVRKLLHPSAAEEVGDAAAAARTVAAGTAGLVAVPLLSTAGPSVREHSLGLPLALAWASCLTGTALSPHGVATGDIAPDGTVSGVRPGSLDEKAIAAKEAGFSLFVFPSVCPHVVTPPGGMEVSAVSSLEQAWRWMRLYTPGGAADLNCLEVAVGNPRCFLAHCRTLSPALLDWCRQEEGLGTLSPRELADGDFLRALTRRLEDCLDGDDLGAAAAVASLLPLGSDLEQAAAAAPLTAFGWCSANLALAGGVGRAAEAEAWAVRADGFPDPVRRAAPESHNRFLARKLVHAPGGGAGEDLVAVVAEATARQEEVWALRGGIDPVLGGLHEALARHHGLAGPEHLDDTRRHLARAQYALGGGEMPEFLGPWRRQFRWLAFALLDAGGFEEAGRTVLASLGVTSWARALQTTEGVQQHVVARFLADAWEDLAPDPRRKAAAQAVVARAKLGGRPAGRPEHLWLYNAGRLAKRLDALDLAQEIWRRSADRCAASGGEAARAAAFLPLSALASHGVLDPAGESLVRQVLDGLRGWAGVRGHSLEALLDLSGSGHALEQVAATPARFFPFDRR